MSLRFIAKIGLLLVVIGFFMPIACNLNGFEIANTMIKGKHVLEGLLVYLMFITAIVGVLIGVSLLMGRGVAGNIDWTVIIICIASGLIVYLGSLKQIRSLQTGAYLILIGWIIAFVGQLLSNMRRE